MNLALSPTASGGTSGGKPPLRATLNASPAAPLSEGASQLLTSLLQDVGADPSAIRQRLQSWFDDSMERLAGTFKRKTQLFISGLALLVAGLLNVDTLEIATRLQNDGALRDGLVAQARQAVAQNAPGSDTASGSQSRAVNPDAIKWQQQLGKIRLPIGWGTDDTETGLPESFGDWWRKVAGILITAVALSLGAPFWFDLLGKLVNLRQTGIPRDEMPPRPAPVPGGARAAPSSAMSPSANQTSATPISGSANAH